MVTTILRYLRYTIEMIFDLLDFIYSFQIVEGLFRLVGDVLEFAFVKPMEYYGDYIGKPALKVCTYF